MRGATTARPPRREESPESGLPVHAIVAVADIMNVFQFYAYGNRRTSGVTRGGAACGAFPRGAGAGRGGEGRAPDLRRNE
jgi:hypothetical protein